MQEGDGSLTTSDVHVLDVCGGDPEELPAFVDRIDNDSLVNFEIGDEAGFGHEGDLRFFWPTKSAKKEGSYRTFRLEDNVEAEGVRSGAWFPSLFH